MQLTFLLIWGQYLVCGCNEEAEEEQEEQQQEFYIATQENQKHESHSSATTTTATTTTTALRGEALRPGAAPSPLPPASRSLNGCPFAARYIPSNKNRPTLGTHCGARSQHVGRPARIPRVYLETWHALRPHCASCSFTGCPFAARYL